MSFFNTTTKMNTVPKLKTLKTLQQKQTIIIRNDGYPWFCRTEKRSFVHKSDVYTWDLCYNTIRDGFLANDKSKMTLEFDREVDGSVTVEADGLQARTFAFSYSKKCCFYHVPFRHIYLDGKGELEVTITVQVDVEVDYVPEVRTDFTGYYNVPTDFEIHCENKQYNAHKDVLSMISPVFEAMLRHSFVETRCNKLQINDFDFETVETAMNMCYGCPPSDITIEMLISVLHFAEKYLMTDITDELEKVLIHNIPIHFCAALRYADYYAKTDIYTKCVTFYRTYKNFINTTDDFKALPESLIINLLKTSLRLETEFELFKYARENGILLGIVLKPFSVKITTLTEFSFIVCYAWNNQVDDLKLKCAQFFQQNKEKREIEKGWMFKYYSTAIQDSLVYLGRCFQLSRSFQGYYDIPTDFEIHCGNFYYKVHKDVLVEVSPFFKAMIHNNNIEASPKKLQINDFSFETVETALNYLYERPLSDFSVALVIDVLYFANKYDMTASFAQLEGLLLHDLTIDRCAVLRYAETCGRMDLFFYISNDFKC